MQPSVPVIPQLDSTSASDGEEEETTEALDLKGKKVKKSSVGVKEKRKR